MRGRRAATRRSEERTELLRRLGEAERTISELRAELRRVHGQALDIARQFEQEAAARAEAEEVAELLRNERAQLLSEADELRARLAAVAGEGDAEEGEPRAG